MHEFQSLTNHFLIAMPNLGDPNFFRTVTLICEHTPEGAMGIVINRPTELSLRDILQQMSISGEQSKLIDMPVHLGGPVQGNRGFVLHQPLGQWESTLAVTERLGVSTSRDILQAMAENKGPENCLLALGYAGWAAGQLEWEITQNAWLSGPATSEIVFNTPTEARWRAAASALGIDLMHLSGEAGHA